MMTPEITALCAAIDAGDDSALPILADALEEAGLLSLSQGRERWLACEPLCADRGLGTSWLWGSSYPWSVRPSLLYEQRHLVPSSVFDRLAGTPYGDSGSLRRFSSRSAAYLALAEALSA